MNCPVAFCTVGEHIAVSTAFGYADFPDFRSAAEFVEQLRAMCALIALIQELRRQP